MLVLTTIRYVPRLICLLIWGSSQTPGEKAERQKQYFMLFWIIQGLVFPKVRLGLIILENMDTNKMLLQVLINSFIGNTHRTFYSVTSILKKCRKVVLEEWFFKLGFFFLVNHFSRTRKNVDLWYKTIFFSGQPLFSNQISWTRFLEPDFSNHFSSPF